jgi:ELWxxDGT repeat protein
MLKNINTNGTGSLTHKSSVSNSVGSWEAATLNGTTYFSAFDGTSRELWMTDGTTSGTCKVTQMHDRNAYPYSGLDKTYSWMTDPARGANGPLHMFANEATNSLLFIHRDQNNNKAELWQYDPDASQGRADCTQNPQILATMGPALHKLADLGDYGRANYMPVSLGDGEVVLESLCSGQDCLMSIDATVSYSAPPTTASTTPTTIYLGSSTTHLNGNDGANYHQSEHAMTNRSANTDEELHVRLGPKDHAVMNGIYYFAASVSGADAKGRELYAYDPATPGTAYLVKDIRNGTHDSIRWGKFEVVRDRLYFVADDGFHGREMWVTDGTTSDTHMLIDLVPQTGSPDIYRITGDLSSVYFIADDGVHGYELWHTDGTNNGTVMLTNHNGTMDAFNYPQTAPATLDGYYGEIIAIGPMVYYSADDGVHGTELYYGYFFTTTTPW